MGNFQVFCQNFPGPCNRGMERAVSGSFGGLSVRRWRGDLSHSGYMHKEVVLPALMLLRDPKFATAEKEYLEAHEAYRHGRLEDCIVSCGKAFESVLKVIGRGRGWPVQENDPASKLIQAAVTAGFLPNYSQTSLNSLKALMESSTPAVRNKVGGHGAGVTPRQVPSHLAAFQLDGSKNLALRRSF